jgi:hypothetical protein
MGCVLSTARVAQTGGSSSNVLDTKARDVNAIVHDDDLKTPAGSDAVAGSGSYVAAAAAISGAYANAPALTEGDLHERLVSAKTLVCGSYLMLLKY